MTRGELEQLVQKGEGLHLEFKRKLPEPWKLAREAVALANTQGGWLLLGVDDSGEIIGVKDYLEVLETFPVWMERYTRPLIPFSLQTVAMSRKRAVVAVRIQKSVQKPHLLLESPEDKKGTALIRIEDRSATASTEVYHILRFEGRNHDLKVELGEKEQSLLRYLENHEYIGLETFSKIAHISRYVASRTLVHLVRANVLQIQPNEAGDRYSLAF